LQTSPELCMKRLVSAGAERIFQVTRAFRRGESGALHNPEFTMVEWYAVGTTHHEQMDFVESLVRELHAAATDDGEHRNAADGSEAAIAAEARAGLSSSPFRRLTYSEAFRNSLGVEDVLRCDAGRLARLAASAGVRAPDSVSATDVDRDTWLNLLLAERVQPNLGRNVPEFMYDFPASQAALARVRAGDPPVAERFELYWRGVELCNGYQELTDADELRERIQQQNALRRREGKRTLPAPTTLLAAMDFGLPECSGVALGFDRLAMLLLGARRLDAVTAFPFERC
ncbi:MAG: EF-P lysine aminoacylase GenX, partial [Planctomycetota bacterium]